MAGAGVPRTAVITAAWSRLSGLEVLSGADGGPLTRTVKCVLDPLVIRPVAHPELGAPLLEEAEAAALTQRLLDHAEVLTRTAAWYPVLKQRRRALRITAGNPQETCFPIAFELATRHGEPGEDAATIADAALQDLAGDHSCLDGLFDDPRLDGQLADSWDRTGHDTADWAIHEPEATAALLATLRALGTETAATAWAAWLGGPSPTALAESLRFGKGDEVLRRAVEAALPGAVAAPALLQVLGLAEGAILQRPAIRGTLPDAVLERSIERRLRSAARRATQAPQDLIEDEIARAGEPGGLFSTPLVAAFLLGVVLSPAIRPLAPTEAIGDPPQVLAEIRTRFAREAYVLRARRYVAGETALTEAPDPGLAQVMRDLIELYRPFLRRLWVRLHGFEHAGTGTLDAEAVRDLLTGVARSVSLDLRTRIRRTLERQVVPA